MFLKIIKHKGFWKSVLVLGIVYGCILFFIQWAMVGFNAAIFSLKTFVGLLIASFIVGFLMTYGKFWGKLKSDEYRK